MAGALRVTQQLFCSYLIGLLQARRGINRCEWPAAATRARFTSGAEMHTAVLVREVAIQLQSRRSTVCTLPALAGNAAN